VVTRDPAGPFSQAELQLVCDDIEESCEVKRAAVARLGQLIIASADMLVASLRRGGKVLFCGNGGSAADAQHLAAELVGRFAFDRAPLAAMALHANTSSLTAIGNDYGYEEVFARQVRAFAGPGDVVVGISTSGNSANVVNALKVAHEIPCLTIGLTGEGGGNMARFCDVLLDVPSKHTPRVQECHITLGHIICGLVEKRVFGQAGAVDEGCE